MQVASSAALAVPSLLWLARHLDLRDSLTPAAVSAAFKLPSLCATADMRRASVVQLEGGLLRTTSSQQLDVDGWEDGEMGRQPGRCTIQ